MNADPTAPSKACCADLYQSELAQLILGDTRHPGGLGLTNRLGRLMGLKRGDRVVDLASSNGVSALAIARTFHCQVVGIEYGRAAAVQAWKRARDAVVPTQAWFLQGDAELPPLKPTAFDAVIAECSLSLFPNKEMALQQCATLLRSGGKLGISDVTLEPGCLPEELNNSLGQMLCMTEALGVEGYAGLIKGAGLVDLSRENASEHLSELLDKIKSGLQALAYFAGPESVLATEPMLPDLPANTNWIALVDKLKQLLDQGLLGYWIYVGEKP